MVTNGDEPASHSSSHSFCLIERGTDNGMVQSSDWYNSRFKQMLNSYVMKNGPQIQDSPQWIEAINSVTIAAMQLDLFATPHKSKVKTSVEDTFDSTSTRNSVFIFYNYSRICAILTAFKDKCKQEEYRP